MNDFENHLLSQLLSCKTFEKDSRFHKRISNICIIQLQSTINYIDYSEDMSKNNLHVEFGRTQQIIFKCDL